MEPLAEVPGNKTVQLVVECPLPWCFELRLYDRPVPVPAAASLLDVLQVAAALEPRDFRYGGITLVMATCPAPVPCARLTPAPSTQLPWEQLCTGASSAQARPSPPDPTVQPPGSTPGTPPRAPS